MREQRELIAAFGQLANDYDREHVKGAAANILMNVLRQSHTNLDECEEEFDDLVSKMKEGLRKSHYHEDGTRNDRRIVLPPLRDLLHA